MWLLFSMHSTNPKLPRSQGTIYVVDDLQSIAELTTLCLRRAGYRTEMFLDPLAALEAFSSADPKPALLITDFSMPEMNGLQLMARCKDLAPGLKTIAHSGTLAESDCAAYQMEPDIILTKPAHIEDLVKAVKRLLGDDGTNLS